MTKKAGAAQVKKLLRATLLVADIPNSDGIIYTSESLQDMVARDKTGNLIWDSKSKRLLFCGLESDLLKIYMAPECNARNTTQLEYDVVAAEWLDPLVAATNARISEGWKPLGNPFQLTTTNRICQAMTRRK